MISEIDQALRELLLRNLPMRRGEVDIVFDQPKREWSARLSKPSLNLYLYDIRENIELRVSQQVQRQPVDDNRISLRFTPQRFDLCYLVTGWAKDIQDEHLLLSSALMTFLRHPLLPDDLTPSELKQPELPVRLAIAQSSETRDVTDLWNTLDNEMHPAIRVKVTIAIEPIAPQIVPAVTTTELDFVRKPNADEIAARPEGQPPKPVKASSRFMVRGKITSQKYSPSVLKLVLKETGQEIEIREDGEFHVTRLQAGEYHLDVLANERLLKHQKIQVPSPSYDITL